MYYCKECNSELNFKSYAGNPYPLAVCKICGKQYGLVLQEDAENGWSIKVVEFFIPYTGSY